MNGRAGSKCAGSVRTGQALPATPPALPLRPRMLASVRTDQEARDALAAGAGILDAKEPRTGALGALPLPVIAAIVAAAGGRVPVSATVGDLPLDAGVLAPAMLDVAASGVDIVKVGLFGPPDRARLQACLAALPATLPNGRHGAARVAVLMADQGGIDWPLSSFAQAGFAGVMLDTADKRRGGLRAALASAALASFVRQVQALGLWAGLAGSLGLEDIAPLAALHPDYLGFRTALCRSGVRGGVLDRAACRAVALRVAGPALRQAAPGADMQADRSPAPPIC